MAAGDVVEWIRERIRRGRFVPGQRLVEADIMRELRASRSRVREAPQRLARIQAELNVLEHTSDHERFARPNDEWHRLIIEGSGNQYVQMFVESLCIPIYRLLFTTFYNARRIDQANAGHRRVAEAIVQSRSKSAERFMREHIAEGLTALARIEDAFE